MVSIITINYNNADGLRRTAKSVMSQLSQDYEWIVIDGGSTDGSKEVIREYSDFIDDWVSEKDAGVYDAMNKGIARATGEYLIFLNSGDFFHDAHVLADFNSQNFTAAVVYGNCKLATDKFTKFYTWILPSHLTLMFFYRGALNHQSTFYHKSCFKNLLYDTNFKICADKHLTLQLFYRGYEFRHWNRLITIFENENGLSTRDPRSTQAESMRTFRDVVPEHISKDYALLIQIEDVDLFIDIRNIIDTNKFIRNITRLALIPSKILCRLYNRAKNRSKNQI